MTRCKSCGAEIVWCVTISGRRMPLDAQPVTVFEIFDRTDGNHARAVTGHQSHFATCPDADQHRKTVRRSA